MILGVNVPQLNFIMTFVSNIVACNIYLCFNVAPLIEEPLKHIFFQYLPLHSFKYLTQYTKGRAEQRVNLCFLRGWELQMLYILSFRGLPHLPLNNNEIYCDILMQFTESMRWNLSLILATGQILIWVSLI